MGIVRAMSLEVKGDGWVYCCKDDGPAVVTDEACDTAI